MSYPIAPYMLANSQGIPRLRATAVTVTATEVRFSFQNHPFLNAPFIGKLLFKLPAIPAGTTETLPVVFATNGNSQAAVNYDTGEPLTAADVARAGIYDAIYDSEDGVLYIHPTTAPTAAADVARAGIYDAIYDSEDGVLYIHPTTAPTAAAGASN